MNKDHAPTATDICDRLGRTAIANAVGVGLTAVSNAAVDNRFPARWFFAVKSLCEKSGIDCPEELFSFIPVRKAPEGAA
ncbi:hypothetical protein [Paracoccus sp. (in: a-proteobacteria)]|uniref:hypothetical protein n=1 Tax=Paracoccus sp. TaxID=267 RepID=UPI002AFF1EC3|nr:hypothetical protein [Paracoccus sp. (in: a-proteobacteria)]